MKTLLLTLTISALLLATWGDNPVAGHEPQPDHQRLRTQPRLPRRPDTNQVDTPTAGDRVSSPVTVRGRILAFEAVFKVTIFDAAGNTIADARGMSAEGHVLSPFEVQVPVLRNCRDPGLHVGIRAKRPRRQPRKCGPDPSPARPRWGCRGPAWDRRRVSARFRRLAGGRCAGRNSAFPLRRYSPSCGSKASLGRAKSRAGLH